MTRLGLGDEKRLMEDSKLIKRAIGSRITISLNRLKI